MSPLSTAPEWIIVDWGTTNFRAFVMNADNQCIDRIEKKTGLLHVENQDFEQVLRSNLATWFDNFPSLSVFMAGMIGSQHGWHEADYIHTPLALDTLGSSCLHFQTKWGAQVRIVPGICHHFNQDKFDVMRGEEVQILGLTKLGYHKNCFAILPGTHSKHANITDGKLASFSTFMTGEFFALLSEHSILGKNLSEQISSTSAFIKGVFDGCDGNLMHTAFMARTHRLFEQLQESEIHDYLSGVLIGKEVSGIDKTCYVISSEKLGKRYALACDTLNKPATIVNGDDCFIAGMIAIKEQILCHTH
jgi:2-dehydro-3-deoxygalactonokinase